MGLQRWMPPAALVFGALIGACSAAAQQPTWEAVGPIFAENCTRCHGGLLPRAGLDLRSYASALSGSSRGPVLIAGNPDASLLVQRIRGDIPPRMPRGAPPLSEAQIALITAWITAGMPQ
jgi:mono/diheme cytochrome c family protein